MRGFPLFFLPKIEKNPLPGDQPLITGIYHSCKSAMMSVKTDAISCQAIGIAPEVL